MSSKSYTKHKELKEFHSSSKSSGNFDDEHFNKLKSELIPRTKTNFDAIGQNGGHKEYHYEYKEEKHPSGKYDRKDLHTVQEYSIPPKSPTPKKSESSHYYYEREERDLAPINTSYNNSASKSYNYESSATSPGYAKITSSKATRDLAHNVDELDNLLDDLQKDQERKVYKSSGYISDNNESSSSYDYRKLSPAKTPSSGYSSLKKEERVESSSWSSPLPPPVTRSAELRQEQRVETSSWSSPPPPPAITRSAEMRQEMYREEKTESRVIPSQISPAIAHPVPAPVCINCQQATTGTLPRAPPMNQVRTTVRTYTYELPADLDPTAVSLPVTPDHERTYYSSTEHLTSSNTQHRPPPPTITQHYHHSANSEDRTSERVMYPKPVNEVRVVPHEPLNGHGPYGPSTYKYSETTYSAENKTERFPSVPPELPRSPRAQEQLPPKRLDDLMADFPEARFPTQPDGMYHRKVEVVQESAQSESRGSVPVKNVAGPPVYYPPGHTPFEKKEVASYQSSAMQSGGGHASGKAMYEYESGSKSKSKTSEKKTAVPVCLPLCCAMPCVIM